MPFVPRTPAEPAPLSDEELAEWYSATMQRLQAIHDKHMAEWAYLQSDEYKESVRQRILNAAHEPINPPWEE